MFRLLSKTVAAIVCGTATLALAVALAVPANFTAAPIDSRNKALLTWSSGADQVRLFAQKKLLDGTWEPLSGFPRNETNTGRYVVDTPATRTGTFRFFVKAKQGSTYSAETARIELRDMH